jgi:hypothetical protein
MSSKQTANGPHPAAAESSPHPHNHLRLGRTSDPFLSIFVYAVCIFYSLRFVISVSSAAGRRKEVVWMLLVFTDWSYPQREEARFPFQSTRFLAQAMALLCLVLSLLPPYGGFNHTVLVQIFYICFHSYNFNSTQRINQGTQNTF